MARTNLYQLLGVHPDADAAAIRRAYQKLARRYHPELHPGSAEAEKRFGELTRAFEVLSDPQLRRYYDHQLGLSRDGVDDDGEPVVAERWQPPSQVHRTFESVTYLGWTQSRKESSGDDDSRRGADLTVELTLDFAEAVRGTTASFSVQREVPCEECEGPADGGEICSHCGGRGTVVDLERLRVRLPPAIDDGSRLRLARRGNPGTGGGAPGDLYLIARVRPHSYFRRQGLDVHVDLPITLAEAVLGAQVRVPTLDGPVTVRVPAGTSGGQRFRLKGRGIELADGRRGDHYYTVRVEVPRRLTPALEELLQRLEPEDPRRDLPYEPL